MNESMWQRQMPNESGLWFFRSDAKDQPRLISVTIDDYGEAHFECYEAMRVFDRNSPDPQWAKAEGNK